MSNEAASPSNQPGNQMSDALSFEEIRPYRDSEFRVVIDRISEKHSFYLLMEYLFPGTRVEDIRAELKSLKSIRDFQVKFIQRVIRSFISQGTDGLSHEGFDRLDQAQPYLFISNHRDIILDSAFLNVLLFENGLETTEIGIGNNLLISRLATDLMKLNKSFIVHRNVARQQTYAYSERLSRYIRHAITEEGNSIWIAQRNGRTKDGNDRTQAALLKMFHISGDADFVGSFKALNLVPVSVSYEWEPCDGEKAWEILHHEKGVPFVKEPDSDKKSMIRGIVEPKGRVYLAIGSPLGDKIEPLGEIANRNERFTRFAEMIDKEIVSNFRLFPNHYIAYDLLHSVSRFSDQYSDEEKRAFEAHFVKRLEGLKTDISGLEEVFLSIYANPLKNRLRLFPDEM
jgi:hypothetical protein